MPRKQTPVAIPQVSERTLALLRYTARERKAQRKPQLADMHKASLLAAMSPKRDFVIYRTRRTRKHDSSFDLTERGEAILKHFG